jgi:hypothetical protein
MFLIQNVFYINWGFHVSSEDKLLCIGAINVYSLTNKFVYNPMRTDAVGTRLNARMISNRPQSGIMGSDHGYLSSFPVLR